MGIKALQGLFAVQVVDVFGKVFAQNYVYELKTHLAPGARITVSNVFQQDTKGNYLAGFFSLNPYIATDVGISENLTRSDAKVTVQWVPSTAVLDDGRVLGKAL